MRGVPLSAPKSEADKGCGSGPVAEQRRFGVGVEAQAHGDAGVVGPRFWRQLAADAGELDGLPQLLLRPFRPRLNGALRLGADVCKSHDADGRGQEEHDARREWCGHGKFGDSLSERRR
jgi:hypothetical protein